MWDTILAILTHPVTLLTLGGGAGTNARYWLGRAVVRLQGPVEFPWATLLINVTGSAILGLVAGAYLGHPDHVRKNCYLLLGTGFCGGYTTFSTFSYETFQLIRDGKPAVAIGYALGSVLAGLIGVWLALKIMGK